MSSIFSHIIGITIPACYVILFVITVRFLLKKAPKKFSYALWGIVLLRLTLPFKISSVLSLIPKKATSMPTKEYFTPQISVPNNNFVNYDSLTGTQTVITPNIVTEQTTSFKEIIINIIPYIWVIGILILLIYSVISCVMLYKKLNNAKYINNNIYESEKINTAFVFGIIKPKIYLPLSLTPEEKKYVILHEQTHIKRFDHIVKIIAFGVATVYWFNPLVWVAFILMSRDMEMSCDETVLNKLGTDIKKTYSQSLLSLATGKRTLTPTPLAFSEENPKHRIKNVLSYKKPSFWVIIVCVFAIIALCIGLLSNPKEDTIDEASLVNAEIIDIDTQYKTLIIKGIEKADENSLSGDRCYLYCDEATIYKDDAEIDFSQLKIGNKIACEINEVLESYPTQTSTEKIIITDESFTEPLFKFNTNSLDSLDTLENVSGVAFGEYTKYLNSKIDSEVDKEDYTLENNILVSGDIRDFVYEYKYTHIRPIDSFMPKETIVQLHIVNINGNGLQYYVMSADETDIKPTVETIEKTVIDKQELEKMKAHPGDYVYEMPIMYNQKQYTLKMKMTDEDYQYGVPENKDLLCGQFQFELYDRNDKLVNTLPLVTPAVSELGFTFDLGSPQIYFNDGYKTIKEDNTQYPFFIFGQRDGQFPCNVYGIDKNGQLKQYTFDYGDYPSGDGDNKTMQFSDSFKIFPDGSATDTFIDYNGNKNYIAYYLYPEDCKIKVVEYDFKGKNDKVEPKIVCNKTTFKAGEKIDIYGEILYTGDRDQVKIYSGPFLAIPSITGDNLFDNDQYSCNPESILETYTLKNSVPVKVDFTDFIWCSDDDPNKEIYDEIKNSKEMRLPAGNYEFKIDLSYYYSSNATNIHEQTVTFPITVTGDTE